MSSFTDLLHATASLVDFGNRVCSLPIGNLHYLYWVTTRGLSHCPNMSPATGLYRNVQVIGQGCFQASIWLAVVTLYMQIPQPHGHGLMATGRMWLPPVARLALWSPTYSLFSPLTKVHTDAVNCLYCVPWKQLVPTEAYSIAELLLHIGYKSTTPIA